MMNSEKADKTGASNLSADNSMAKAWVSSITHWPLRLIPGFFYICSSSNILKILIFRNGLKEALE